MPFQTRGERANDMLLSYRHAIVIWGTPVLTSLVMIYLGRGDGEGVVPRIYEKENSGHYTTCRAVKKRETHELYSLFSGYRVERYGNV